MKLSTCSPNKNITCSHQERLGIPPFFLTLVSPTSQGLLQSCWRFQPYRFFNMWRSPWAVHFGLHGKIRFCPTCIANWQKLTFRGPCWMYPVSPIQFGRSHVTPSKPIQAQPLKGCALNYIEQWDNLVSLPSICTAVDGGFDGDPRVKRVRRLKLLLS